MSFINISTNQQTTAQRQMTERTPANLRNDFKVPIEIKKGDQMELVSLRLHLSSAIRIMEDENDTFVWTWGNAPNWTQHIVIVPDAPYYDGNEFANMVEACLNDSTTIPSFDRDVNEADHYNPTIQGGWSVTYTPVGGAITSAKYEIDNQQCTYMPDVTNGTIAQGHIGNLEKVLNSQLHSRRQQEFQSLNAEESFENVAGNYSMRQSWISFTHDPSNDNTGALGDLNVGDLEQEVTDSPAGNIFNSYLGRNFDYGQMSNVATFRAGRNGEQNPARCISSIYDNGGKVFCTTSPLWGYKLSDFTDSANLVGPDVTLQIEMEKDTDTKLVVKEERIFTITKLANPGTTDNNWHLRLDLKAGEADFNPLIPGVSGPTFKRLYMHYIPEEGSNDPALESPFKNGLWAIGGYVDAADPTGGDGTGAVPPDALNADNWNFCVDAGVDEGIDNYGPRNVWFYDQEAGLFQPGISFALNPDPADVIRLDYDISGVRHDINEPVIRDSTPIIVPTAGGGFSLTPTRHIGYNNVRVGLNSFNSYVNPDYTHKTSNLGGDEPFGAQTNLENCRWQIQLFNDPTNVNLDANGVNCPRCQIIGTENPEDTFPVDGNPFKSKIVEEIDLLTHSSNIVAASVAAGPIQVMIDETNRNSRTGALNVSQAIVVPPQFQGHDVTTVELHLNNSSGSVMNLVLDLYDSITDATSTNVATRFAGLTPFSTTPVSSVPATGTTGFVIFDIDADTSIHNTFYIVLREENNGSMSGLSIQGSFGVDLGGSNGNMLAGLKHKVKGNSVGSIGGFTPLTHDLCICVEITEVSTLKFYALQTPKYRLENPAGGAPVNPHVTPEDAYQTDSAKTPTDAELQANLLFTLDNSGSTYGAKDTSYIKESHYPLVPVIACGAGGYYSATTLAAEQTLWGNEIGSYNCWDMQLAYRDIPTSKANRQIYEAFPYRWIEEQPNNVPGAGDPPTAIKGTGYCFKFGKLLDTQIGAPQDPDPTVQNHYVTYQSTVAEPYVNTVIAELFPLNISSLQRILGFENLVQSTKNSTHFDPPIASTRRINEMPIGDTFTVELTSTPIKGYNGGTGDVNKALAVINVEELEVDSQSDGGVIYSTSTRRPVDLNIAQDTSFHSLNIQLRDANGKILRAVEAPLDVVLYKSQPESAKMEQAIRELKDVIEGKKQDARDVQLANIGVNNPLLGVIPR
jgi:hypothetical protein